MTTTTRSLAKDNNSSGNYQALWLLANNKIFTNPKAQLIFQVNRSWRYKRSSHRSLEREWGEQRAGDIFGLLPVPDPRPGGVDTDANADSDVATTTSRLRRRRWRFLSDHFDSYSKTSIFFKWANSRLFSVYFLSFQTFFTTINVKNVMSIQYRAPGFKHTTSLILVIAHNY